MKGKLKFIAILSIAFVVFVLIKLFFDIASKKEGRLQVFSRPGAAIFIDNVMKGNTPFINTFKEGEYVLKVVPDGVATSAASWQKKISIFSGALTYVDVQLENTDISTWADLYWLTKQAGFFNQTSGLVVETEPSGALIYIDTDEKGVSPLTLENVTQGSHELSVFMPGFSRRSKKINISPGFQLHAFIKLALDPSQKSQYTISEPTTATAAASIKEPKNTVRILDTPTGWLRVRNEPTLEGSESARVNPGQRFELVEEQIGWYKIKIDASTQGWISSQYAEKK